MVSFQQQQQKKKNPKSPQGIQRNREVWPSQIKKIKQQKIFLRKTKEYFYLPDKDFKMANVKVPKENGPKEKCGESQQNDV